MGDEGFTIHKLKRYISDKKYRFLINNGLGFYNKMEDKKLLEKMFEVQLGKHLNLNNPRTFNEKIQWLKLFDHNPLYTSMVDKYEVKEIVKKTIGKEYVIPTLGVWDKFDDIDFNLLPKQFVLKCTHDSGSIVICKNKDLFLIDKAKQKINRHLKKNFFYAGREWPYKNIQPRIIAEKYITDESGYEMKDYKFFAFGTDIKVIQVDYDRFNNHHRNFYDIAWKYLPFTTCYPTDKKRRIEKPKCFDEMIECVKQLVNSMGTPPFVRIDLYDIKDHPYFGEITFYHGGGFEEFCPDIYDYTLGEWIKI